MIVGKIPVECVDHLVAVGVGIGEEIASTADLIALGIGITGNIEPVPPPPLAVGWQREQPIEVSAPRPGS